MSKGKLNLMAMFVTVFSLGGLGFLAVVIILLMATGILTGGSGNGDSVELAGSSSSPGAPLNQGSGKTLTALGVLQLAETAGIPRSQLATAVAIAMAESGFNPNATNVNTNGSTDRGLWQINNFAHPDVSDACAFDPSCNAEAMASISSGGTNWTPWMTYDSGAYRQYLLSAQQLVDTFDTSLSGN